MKIFIPVLVVLIIVVGVLLFVRSLNRTAELRRNLADTSNKLNICKSTIRKITAEVNTQAAAGYFDPLPVQAILTDHERDINP